MASRETLYSALRLINSDLSKQMTQLIDELMSADNTLRSGVKSAGPKARKASTEWGKSVGTRLKEMRDGKKLLAQYRKETIAESKG